MVVVEIVVNTVVVAIAIATKSVCKEGEYKGDNGTPHYFMKVSGGYTK